MGVQIVDDVGNFFLNQEGTEAGGPTITNSIQPGSGYAGSVRARLVPKNFHLEICASPFGHVYGVLNVVKQ